MDAIDPASLTFHGAGLNRPECVLCTAEGDLYTAAWRGGVARIGPDGSLGDRETVASFGPGAFPDGLAFNEQGGAWITSVVSNRVVRVAPDGGQTVLLEDSDPEHLARCEAAYALGRFDRSRLDAGRGRYLQNLSSLAFGGPDLRDAYLGCLQGDGVSRFRAPVAGAAPAHWRFQALPSEGSPRGA